MKDLMQYVEMWHSGQITPNEWVNLLEQNDDLRAFYYKKTRELKERRNYAEKSK